MDFGDAAVLGMAQGADQGDDVEAEFMLGESEVALLLGAEGNSPAGAVGRATASDLEPQPDCTAQGRDRTSGLVGRPERPPTVGTGAGEYGQLQGLIGLRAGSPSGHGGTPRSQIHSRSNDFTIPDQEDFAPPSFFEPLELHLEPTDLLGQLGLAGLG